MLYKVGLEYVALSAVLAFAMIKIGSFIFKHVIIPIKETIGNFEHLDMIIGFVVGTVKFLGQTIRAFVVFAAKQVYNVFETIFDIIGEIYNFIVGPKTLESAMQTIYNIVEDIKDFIVTSLSNVDEMILSVELLKDPWESIKDFVVEIRDALEDAVQYAKDLNLGNKAKDAGGGFLDAGADLVGGAYDATFGRLATGGYVRGMSTGGMMGARRPYIVGERGPELFMPSSSGQVINNSRTDSIMRQSLDAGPATKGGAQELVVSQLVVGNAKLKNTRMAVDSFAGVV